MKNLKAKEKKNPNVDLHNFLPIGQNFIWVRERKIQVRIFKARDYKLEFHTSERRKNQKREKTKEKKLIGYLFHVCRSKLQ